MTVTSTPPPTAPDWLNIDTIVSPELRADIADVTARAEAMLPAVTELARASFSAMARFNEALAGDAIGDDMWELIARVTGYDAMSTAMHTLGDRAEAGIDGPGSKPAPWLEGLL